MAMPHSDQSDSTKDVPDAARNAKEREQVSRTREGDSTAFEEIFREYAPGLVGFAAATLHSREPAEEIVQEIFLSIWANRTSWRVDNSLTSYLYQAVRRRIANALRDEKVRARSVSTATIEE